MIRFSKPSKRPPFQPNMELPVYGDEDYAFAGLRNRRVLIYWPHGFGDFVHLSYVAPLLEPSNHYFITRFGDDYVHLYDEPQSISPLYSGVARIGDGTVLGAPPHLGLDADRIRNTVEPIFVPEPLRVRMERAGIDAILYSRYPEMTGRTPYPWHTKARHLLSKLVRPERIAALDLSQPLQSSLQFIIPPAAAAAVEARLRAYCASGDRLYVLSACGHTQPDKMWPEAEVLAFARILRERDPRARLLTVDERSSAEIGRPPGAAPTTTDLLGDLDLPFAHKIVTIIKAAHAFAGTGSGPLHCAIAIGGRPIVGIWLCHWPEYYDEPSNALHLVGPKVLREQLDQRIAAYTKKFMAPHLMYRIERFPDHVPSASDVLDALYRA